MLYEMHMHTPLCKHAIGEPEEYAAVAEQRGLTGIVVTCHNPCDDGWAPDVRMSVAEFDQYVAMVERAQKAWAGRVDIRLGLECDYVPGMERWIEKLLGMAEFHHVLGSVHPQLIDYLARFGTDDAAVFSATYFEHLARAAETGFFDTIAHPDLVKNSDPAGWDVGRAMGDIRACLDRIAVTGTAMEINTSGLNKLLPEMNPGPQMLAEMHARGIPVVMGADAHDPIRVAADFAEALDHLSAAGYGHTSIFLDRQRRDIAIEQARGQLQRAAIQIKGQL